VGSSGPLGQRASVSAGLCCLERLKRIICVVIVRLRWFGRWKGLDTPCCKQVEDAVVVPPGLFARYESVSNEHNMRFGGALASSVLCGEKGE